MHSTMSPSAAWKASLAVLLISLGCGSRLLATRDVLATPGLHPAARHVAMTSPLSRDERASTGGSHPPIQHERLAERKAMVRDQIEARGVKDERVLAAMTLVPRHLFVAERVAEYAYADVPLPIGQAQTISQPYIVALMTELLEIEPGHTILEIGTGSGYQAAVLAELASAVYTIEIIPEIGEWGAENLAPLGYDNIHVIKGVVPDVLAQRCPQEIAFLHLDMNAAQAEIGALDALFDKVVPGGFIVLDDFGRSRLPALCAEETAWMKKRGYEVLELPTGQGLVIKR